MERAELSDDFGMLSLPEARTKNGLCHDVPLPPLARQILTNLQGGPGSNNYVFTTNGRTPISGFSKYKKRLTALMQEFAEREVVDHVVPPWRTHDLRRSASTGMNGIQIPPHIVEAVINHVSGAKGGVAGTYNHEEYQEEKRAALELWAAHISRLVTRQ